MARAAEKARERSAMLAEAARIDPEVLRKPVTR